MMMYWHAAKYKVIPILKCKNGTWVSPPSQRKLKAQQDGLEQCTTGLSTNFKDWNLKQFVSRDIRKNRWQSHHNGVQFLSSDAKYASVYKLWWWSWEVTSIDTREFDSWKGFSIIGKPSLSSLRHLSACIIALGSHFWVCCD
jgi:hypothetical protein